MVVSYVWAGGWCRDESLQETPKLSAVKIKPKTRQPLNRKSRTPKLHIAHLRMRKQPGYWVKKHVASLQEPGEMRAVERPRRQSTLPRQAVATEGDEQKLGLISQKDPTLPTTLSSG